MKYLLDTSACIACLRTKPSPVAARLRQMQPADVAVCSIVRAELMYGARRSRDPSKESKIVDTFLGPLASFPFDDTAADHYANIRHLLERSGQSIGAHDLEIAAIALSRDLTLVTHNVDEFSRVAGLAWEDWENTP